MLFDGNHFLLTDEPMPAAKGLGIIRWVGIIGRHVFAHDLCGIAGNVQAGRETVLRAHACGGFRVNGIPAPIMALNGLGQRIHIVSITHCLCLHLFCVPGLF